MFLRLFFLPVKKIFVSLCLGLALFSWSPFAVAAEKTSDIKPPRIVFRTGNHATYDRLVFEGPRNLTYELHRDNSQVTVQFSTAATINLKTPNLEKLTRAKDFSSTNGDRLVVSFSVAPKAVIKNSKKGSTIIVDISGPPVPSKKDEPIPLPEKKAEPPEPTKEAAKTETPEPEAPKEKQQETKAEQPQPAPAPEPTPTPLPEIGTKPELVATLDPKITIGAAIYARGGTGFIIFDRKVTLDLATLTSGTTPRIRLEPIDLPQNTGFRFTLPKDTNPRAARVNSAWQIFLSTQRSEVAVSTNLIAQPDFALGPRLLLPTSQAPTPLRFTDPVVGDALIIVPLRETAAVSVHRRYADFVIIPAVQGMVIKPFHERLSVQAVPEGIEINAKEGLRLSPTNDTGSSEQTEKRAQAAVAGKLLFDFVAWRGSPEDTFTQTRQKLLETVVEVPEAQRNLARLELARFYFSHGMGEEALGLLAVLTRLSPDLAAHKEFLALRGSSYILAGRTQEGLRDLNAPDLDGQPEIDLWQAVGAAQMRNWEDAEEKFNLAENILLMYPEPFLSRFFILAIESALALNKDHEAAEWLDRIEKRSRLSEVKPALLYLRAVIHSKSGHADMAEELWKEVSHSRNRLYKIRAELALIDLGLATRSLTTEQAIDRLEGLRFAWRGDDLEMDILHRLGGFYLEKKNFKAGLANLAQAVRLYPNSPITPQIRGEMAKTFHDIFLTDAGASLSPVDALTLYQEYPNLVPAGDEGVALGQNLVERLVSVDLLDQASGLLESYVKNSTKNEEKARLGIRLAAIRLLDHKPEAALAALDMSQGDGLPDSLKSEQHLLRARALSEQKKYDEALGLLQNDASAPAKALSANIYMRAQRWPDAAKQIRELVGPPPRPEPCSRPTPPLSWLTALLPYRSPTTRLALTASRLTSAQPWRLRLSKTPSVS